MEPYFAFNQHSSIFVIPVADKVLLYAPLHGVAALINRAAAAELRDNLRIATPHLNGRSGEISHLLHAPAAPSPLARQGEFRPTALGILPTRGCNLHCRYCGFLPGEGKKVMTLEMARDVVNWYMDHVERSDTGHAEIHFFGGEPFCAEEVIDVVVMVATDRAEANGCSLHFEAATNGTFSEARCRWVADHLHTIVLSLDGPADVQNFHRPRRGGAGSFETVVRNAHILSESSISLSLRTCVTAATVERMVEIADWFCQEFRPAAVCFEPLQPNRWSEQAGLEPPDPYLFARHFIAASELLAIHGIAAIYATTDIRNHQVTFCPVGKDFVIVSPDGTLSACYLLRQDWETKGFDLRLGQVDTANGNRVHINRAQVEAVRRINVLNKPLCAKCFCKWHCAGGCHVNHTMSKTPGDYDRLCIQTRLITLYTVLRALGCDGLLHSWLAGTDDLQATIHQTSDCLLDWETVP